MSTEETASFIKDCILQSHPDQDGPMFFEENGRFYARLQDMVIMPRERYETLLLGGISYVPMRSWNTRRPT